MNPNLSPLEKKFSEADERMHQLDADLKFLAQVAERYPTIRENLQKLEDYYFSEAYREDLQNLRKQVPDENYWSSGEDGIWNLGIEFRSLRVKLLKMLSDDLYEDTLKIG